ncbi:putative quinol monooxygenase [Mesorhizobium sp. M7A.F.Ca.US.008.03.1.1]|uniref:putative quinol monooxygenase n=1 Tax=Mesorhizobium sp. M7A.F.Ca.US.008.03.1.1 TaxID=2496742 RepID=UPI000FCC15CB|nr:putative quinol monooxygenase [Mesorhizobium sp. M7A.F.Ca.US.008.03.1.1]RUW60724.1 antibiotic biosynthesis monooxygenase [Mesorhizobium sp. M7A.F.Ca.US.008.03.1.1]
MSGFVIIVDFRLKEGALAAFRPMIDANATASVRDEPGCRRFDVVEPEEEPGRILIYEIYDDAAAFEYHCRTPHFLNFDAQSAPLLNEKKIIRAALVCEGSS